MVRFVRFGFCLAWMCLAAQGAAESSGIDNSALIPPIRSDRNVRMDGRSPDWVKSLIMVQFRIETVTPEGTFASAVRVLDHYAEMGVNGLWINPVYERGSKGNGYGNFGPHTVEPLLTGTADIEKSYEEIRRFVDEAHQRNIRVVFDIIVWGTAKRSPLAQEHPEFYQQNPDGSLKDSYWGGYDFNWDSQDLREWFTETAVRFIEETGADGFRVDLAPDRSGYYFEEVRKELYRRGLKKIIISEMSSDPKDTFDFSQLGVNGWTESPDRKTLGAFAAQKKRFGETHSSTFMFLTNLVDMVRSGDGIGRLSLQRSGLGGKFRYYSASLLCHDQPDPFVQGNRVRFGYLVLAPFIPMWWVGEEWNNPKSLLPKNTGVVYFNRINWDAKEQPQNRAFFEDAKQILRIRRSHPDIFEYFADSCRDANIEKVDSLRDGKPNPLQAYLRYRDDKAVLVVPDYQSQTPQSDFSIDADFRSLGFNTKEVCTVTDLLRGEEIAKGPLRELFPLNTVIAAEHLGIYLVQPE